MEKEKSISYLEELIFLVTLFKTNYSYERSDIEASKLIEHLRVISKYDDKLISQEEISDIEKNIIPALDSIYARDVAIVKLKNVIEGLSFKLISKIKSTLNLYSSEFSELRFKVDLVQTILNVSKDIIKYLATTKDKINRDFKAKEAFLKDVKEKLAVIYRGDIYINNSATELGKVLSKILNSLFQEGDLTHGRSLVQNHNLSEIIKTITAYIGPNDINNLNYEKSIGGFDFKTVDNALKESLPEVIKSETGDIISYIQRLGVNEAEKTVDDPQTLTLIWTKTITDAILAWTRADKYFKEDIQNLLMSVSNNDIKPFKEMLDNMEDIYRNKNEENSPLLDQYVKLLSVSISIFDIDLETKRYDIRQFLAPLNYLFFIFVLLKNVTDETTTRVDN